MLRLRPAQPLRYRSGSFRPRTAPLQSQPSRLWACRADIGPKQSSSAGGAATLCRQDGWAARPPTASPTAKHMPRCSPRRASLASQMPLKDPFRGFVVACRAHAVLACAMRLGNREESHLGTLRGYGLQ